MKHPHNKTLLMQHRKYAYRLHRTQHLHKDQHCHWAKHQTVRHLMFHRAQILMQLYAQISRNKTECPRGPEAHRTKH